MNSSHSIVDRISNYGDAYQQYLKDRNIKMEYPTIHDIYHTLFYIIENTSLKTKSTDDVDIDDLVYETISLWDRTFSDDPNWFNDDDTDVKDELRDEVLKFWDKAMNSHLVKTY